VSTELIRWTDASGGGFFGFAGSYAPAAFKVIPPDAGEDFWTLHNYICPLGVSGFGETEAEIKQQAESWLRQFAPSLGALFATDLRQHLKEQVAIEQELGDGHDEQGHNITSREHWARAGALRDVLRYIDREAGRMCPGGCGCRLGTDDADRRECGCDEGCCEARQ
jgi:hypothetical protein